MKDENQKEKEAKKRAEAAAERSGLEANEEEYRSLRDRVDKIEATVTAVLTSMDAVLEKMSHAEAVSAALNEQSAGAALAPDGRPRSRSDVRALAGMESETSAGPKSGVSFHFLVSSTRTV